MRSKGKSLNYVALLLAHESTIRPNFEFLSGYLSRFGLRLACRVTGRLASIFPLDLLTRNGHRLRVPAIQPFCPDVLHPTCDVSGGPTPQELRRGKKAKSSGHNTNYGTGRTVESPPYWQLIAKAPVSCAAMSRRHPVLICRLKRGTSERPCRKRMRIPEPSIWIIANARHRRALSTRGSERIITFRWSFGNCKVIDGSCNIL